ncbi:MAG: hypothetical protein KDD37_07490 [Bdellovibrionales bacterium]|nr:hypothetical protein [Bdellovibrionales bacterium]
MIKHLLPAWLPLLLLITFLGCQSFETTSQKTTTTTKAPLIKSCPKATKRIFVNSELQICGNPILKNKNFIVIKNLNLLRRISSKSFNIEFVAKDFQLFKWSSYKKNQLIEIMPIYLNNRYKLLNVSEFIMKCSHKNCLKFVDNCEVSANEQLFPMISYRIKYHLLTEHVDTLKQITNESILQQLVWQSANGDLRAKSILINYKDWLNVKPHMQTRFDHFKKIVERKSKNMCIGKQHQFVTNL